MLLGEHAPKSGYSLRRTACINPALTAAAGRTAAEAPDPIFLLERQAFGDALRLDRQCVRGVDGDGGASMSRSGTGIVYRRAISGIFDDEARALHACMTELNQRADIADA